jgi:phage terminase small subunit
MAKLGISLITLTATMPKLANRRWEIFATELASGAPLLTSYLTAGYKQSYSARFNASRLSNKPAVRERIDELLAEFTRTTFVRLEWIQARLVEIIEGRAESRGGVRDGKPFTEIDRQGALIALAKTLGVVDANISATAIAASGAAADPMAGRSDLDVARRIAYLLHTATGKNGASDVSTAVGISDASPETESNQAG